MKTSALKIALIIGLLFVLAGSESCTTKKRVMSSTQKIPAGTSVAVVIECPNNIKNVVITRFMKKNFKVRAVNYSDLYTMKDIYDVKDFKKISYNASLKNDEKSLLSMEKTFDNIYKLHFYNFEINKIQTLKEIKDKWNVKYLILLDLGEWEEVSWGRAIDLSTLELVWVENYPTQYNDVVETIIDHFINSMMSGM